MELYISETFIGDRQKWVFSFTIHQNLRS